MVHHSLYFHKCLQSQPHYYSILQPTMLEPSEPAQHVLSPAQMHTGVTAPAACCPTHTTDFMPLHLVKAAVCWARATETAATQLWTQALFPILHTMHKVIKMQRKKQLPIPTSITSHNLAADFCFQSWLSLSCLLSYLLSVLKAVPSLAHLTKEPGNAFMPSPSKILYLLQLTHTTVSYSLQYHSWLL